MKSPIRILREAAGMPRKELAGKAGISTLALEAIEGGESPTVGELSDLSTALGVPLEATVSLLAPEIRPRDTASQRVAFAVHHFIAADRHLRELLAALKDGREPEVATKGRRDAIEAAVEDKFGVFVVGSRVEIVGPVEAFSIGPGDRGTVMHICDDGESYKVDIFRDGERVGVFRLAGESLKRAEAPRPFELCDLVELVGEAKGFGTEGTFAPGTRGRICETYDDGAAYEVDIELDGETVDTVTVKGSLLRKVEATP